MPGTNRELTDEEFDNVLNNAFEATFDDLPREQGEVVFEKIPARVAANAILAPSNVRRTQCLVKYQKKERH